MIANTRRLFSTVKGATVFHRANYEKQLWKNGLGYTHEIAIERNDGRQAAPFSWRLSMADLTPVIDGAFSEIPNVDRTLLLLEGDCQLKVNGSPAVDLRIHEPFDFPGDVTTTSTVKNHGRDMNCMVDRSSFTSTVCMLGTEDSALLIPPKDKGVVFIVAVGGDARILLDQGDGHNIINLEKEDSVRFEILSEGVTAVDVLQGKGYVIILSPRE